MRDRIIALDECVPRDVPNPILLGALRAANSKFNWKDEAYEAAKEESRAVLSGHISDLDEIVLSLAEIRVDFPRARFALLIHEKQAVTLRPTPNALRFFENVYVATSEEIDVSNIRQVEDRWRPTWVLVPNVELNRDDWIPRFLVPNRQGRLILLAPGIDADELRLQLENFTFEHPLIEIHPAPHEWFVASELGPWKLASRDPKRTNLSQDSRIHEDYSLSVIIPFRWTGERSHVEVLNRSLKSVRDTFAANGPCEIILAVDREHGCKLLTADDLGIELSNMAFVDVERFNEAADWRAGFIRNCGARFARNKFGFFLFIDADVAIATTLAISRSLQELFSEDNFDLLQLSDSPAALAFQSASSSLLVIRVSLFRQLGGFSDAFSHYGCEDNFLVWSATQNRARISSLPSSTIEHLRPRLESDDLVAKMLRLRPSAKLMYGMTLDPEVHLHFFSALGSDLWWRAVLKRMASHPLFRFVLAPLVFVLTLIETRDRREYLGSFAEVFTWKLKRPVLWVRSNTWRTELVGHMWRANAWKLPNFFISKLGIAKISLEKIWIHLCANRFGWNAVAWRFALWSKILKDQVQWRASVLRIRIAGALLWLLTAIVSIFSNIHWALTVGVGRTVGHLIKTLTRFRTQIMRIKGQVMRIKGPLARARGRLARLRGRLARLRAQLDRLRGPLARLRGRLLLIRGLLAGLLSRWLGEMRRLFVVYIVVPTIYLATRPQALWKLHAWRISKFTGELRAEAWLFREPTEWFKVRTPGFHKWVWRPLLRVRYFLEYHLITRWRKT